MQAGCVQRIVVGGWCSGHGLRKKASLHTLQAQFTRTICWKRAWRRSDACRNCWATARPVGDGALPPFEHAADAEAERMLDLLGLPKEKKGEGHG